MKLLNFFNHVAQIPAKNPHVDTKTFNFYYGIVYDLRIDKFFDIHACQHSNIPKSTPKHIKQKRHSVPL